MLKLHREYRYPWERKRGEFGSVEEGLEAERLRLPGEEEMLVPLDGRSINNRDDERGQVPPSPTPPPKPQLLPSTQSQSSPLSEFVAPGPGRNMGIVPPVIVPRAQFYVDQHISQGQFGRDPLAPGFVYDPNVLQRHAFISSSYFI